MTHTQRGEKTIKKKKRRAWQRAAVYFKELNLGFEKQLKKKATQEIA